MVGNQIRTAIAAAVILLLDMIKSLTPALGARLKLLFLLTFIRHAIYHEDSSGQSVYSMTYECCVPITKSVKKVTKKSKINIKRNVRLL